ncbi:MAG: hypothetical protein RMJ59_00855 [Candidatus Nitrosocaldus sp.]|nr:hypothetical protein [Candidatus Nitrosocaldus sp.]MDW8274914.1 hypothetical protein [Candidatus Nitrosocaldus sp.]
MSMGKREHTLIPKPRSAFILVRCSRCNAERIVYSHSTRGIRCRQCNSLLVENTGGRAVIHAVEVNRFS